MFSGSTGTASLSEIDGLSHCGNTGSEISYSLRHAGTV